MKSVLSILQIGTLCGIALFTPRVIHSQPDDRLKNARDFLKLDLTQAKEFSEKLSTEAAKSLQSQILLVAKPKNPDIEKLNYVLLHLASLSANETGQKRLNNLLLVIMLTVLLFAGFLIFVFMHQRRVIMKLTALSETGAFDAGASDVTIPQQERLTSGKSKRTVTKQSKRR